MRPIDADQLMNELDKLIDEAQKSREYGRAEGLYYAKDEVRNSTTIDAIPVQWIKEKLTLHFDNPYEEPYNSYMFVLLVWKHERGEWPLKSVAPSVPDA